MSVRNQWKRVSHDKVCPVCGRPDWCLLSADGTAAICARVESSTRCGEAGWLHRLVDRPWQPARRTTRSVRITRDRPGPHLEESAMRWQAAIVPDHLDRLARSLGLSVESLAALRIGWATAT